MSRARDWWLTGPKGIWLLLGLVGAYRLSLLGRGGWSFPDETFYFKSFLILTELKGGHIAAALGHIATDGGRPGAALLGLLPASVQLVPMVIFGTGPSNPWSLLIPGTWNVAVTLITLYAFHRICLVLFDGSPMIALTCTAVYGLLVNTNTFIRHLHPYDASLCLAICGFRLVLSRQTTPRFGFRMGLLAAIVVTVYPGYYLLAGAIGIAVVGRDASLTLGRRAQTATAFLSGGVATAVGAEAICRIVGMSYIGSLRTLGATITQGSFDEGWTFLPKYLIEVEGAVGVLLLGGVALYICRAVRDFAAGTGSRPIHWLVLPAAGAWLFQAAAAYYGHSMVLYGRLIHAWYPFLVLALGDALTWPRGRKVSGTLCAVAVVISLGSFAISAPGYYGLAYPTNVLYNLGIDTKQLRADQTRCEMESLYDYSSPAPLNRSGAPYLTSASVAGDVLINFCEGRPAPAPIAASGSLGRELYRAPHFQNWPAYGFEGLRPDERIEILRRRYEVRVYDSRNQAK